MENNLFLRSTASLSKKLSDDDLPPLPQTASQITEMLNSIHSPFGVDEYVSAFLREMQKECIEEGINTVYISKNCLEPMPFPSPVMLQKIVSALQPKGFIFSSFYRDSVRMSVPWHDENSNQEKDLVTNTELNSVLTDADLNLVHTDLDVVLAKHKLDHRPKRFRQAFFVGSSVATLLIGSTLSVAAFFCTFRYLTSSSPIPNVSSEVSLSESQRNEAYIGQAILSILPALLSFGLTINVFSALLDNLFSKKD